MGLNSRVIHKQSQSDRLPQSTRNRPPQSLGDRPPKSTKCTSKVYEIDPNYISEHFLNNQTPFISDKEVKEQEHPGYGKTMEGIPNKQVGIKQ